MHIPSAQTADLSILTFEQALSGSSEDEYDREHWLYVPDFYSEYRYILGTRGKLPLICIGINPSTARPGELDNTLKSVSRIAAGNGFDSFIMFNVYAQRATRPDDMDDDLNQALHLENMKAFAHILSQSSSTAQIWCAWGTIIEKRPYLAACLRDMAELGRNHGAVWHSCGQRSKKGHPHHPLYLRKDAQLEPFDLAEYLASYEL